MEEEERDANILMNTNLPTGQAGDTNEKGEGQESDDSRELKIKYIYKPKDTDSL